MPLPKTEEGLTLWKMRQSDAQKGKSRNINVPRDKFGRFTWGIENDFRQDPRKPKIRFVCQTCGKILWLLPHQLKWHGQPRKYCSSKCIRQKRGIESKCWKGGRFYNNQGIVDLLNYWREQVGERV